LRAIIAIEDADRVGLQFDNKRLDHLIDRLLADRDFDGTVVLASGEFAWTKTSEPLTRRSARGSKPFRRQ
jgi:hypothetical protein